ncbi:MAG: hypothetical protein ABI723_19785 [Bacteroidia bacterium]
MKQKSLLQELVKKREENISLLFKWSDEDIEEMISRYREAKETPMKKIVSKGIKFLKKKYSNCVKRRI